MNSPQDGTLTLLVPGLAAAFEPQPLAPAAAQRAVELMLGRSQFQEGLAAGWEGALLALAGYKADAACDLPIAAISRLGDTGLKDDRWWLRADPVHLEADRDRSVVHPPSSLTLTAEEAKALTGDLARAFSDEPWVWEAPQPRHWYLGTAQSPGIRTYGIEDVALRDMLRLLPAGEQSRRWKGLLTEMQMVLHASPVNQARERRGQPPVNGVWLWGSGRCPPPLDPPFDRIYADDGFSAGVARLGGREWLRLADGAKGNVAGRRPLVVITALHDAALAGDSAGWQHALQQFAADWAEPLLYALRAGRYRQLLWLPGTGECALLDRSRLRRIWRRPMSLGQWLRNRV